MADDLVTGFATLDDLESFLRSMAGLPGEQPGLSALDHGLQCAEVLRAMAPDDEALQIAGLLHDIGESRSEERSHGRVGALAVRGLVGERVSELVRLHVEAKRYLVTTDAAYRAKLSPVSIATLALQGGALDDEELAAFKASPFSRDAVRLRLADDLAKVPGRLVPDLNAWMPGLRQIIGAAR
jgi:predicted HD phosphohydrolase